MDTMKAVVRYGREPGAFDVREMPVPETGPDEVLVRVAWAGICGTDPHTYRTDDGGISSPIIQGHEFSGVLERVGGGVSGWAAGDRVVVESTCHYCGECALCRSGNPNLCADRGTYSYGIHGVFAEFVKAPARVVHRIPEGVTLRSAALAEPMAVAYKAVIDRTRLRPGDTVMVIGPGSIGILSAMMAKLAGAAEVIVVGTEGDDERLTLARAQGATRVVNGSADDPVKAVKELGDGYGAEAVIDTANSSRTIELAFEAVRPGGQVTKIGSGDEPLVVPSSLLWNCITLQGHFGLTWDVWEKCLALMASGRADVAPLITHELDIEDWREGYELVERKEAVKVLFRFGPRD